MGPAVGVTSYSCHGKSKCSLAVGLGLRSICTPLFQQVKGVCIPDYEYWSGVIWKAILLKKVFCHGMEISAVRSCWVYRQQSEAEGALGGIFLLKEILAGVLQLEGHILGRMHISCPREEKYSFKHLPWPRTPWPFWYSSSQIRTILYAGPVLISLILTLGLESSGRWQKRNFLVRRKWFCSLPHWQWPTSSG